MVGTRHASEHGLQASRFFARAFARAGLAVVSGLAYGVDAVSHRGALDAKGKTIAVVGSGVDDASLYPRANLRLGKEILASGGLLVSENPPGTKPQNWDFPKRNRIIAALAAATVVVEAPIKSGALITAKSALELGREVYAVPADALKESAKGSNKLIIDGASPIIDPDDLLTAVFPNLDPSRPVNPAAIMPQNPAEAAVMNALKAGPKHVDDLIGESKLAASTVQASLTALELRGAIVSLGNMRYASSHA
jgi:DNA processing protein